MSMSETHSRKTIILLDFVNTDPIKNLVFFRKKCKSDKNFSKGVSYEDCISSKIVKTIKNIL